MSSSAAGPPSTRLSASLLAAVALATLISLLGAAPAFAASPWWHLTSGSRPTDLQPGSEAQIVVTAANLGDASVNGETSSVRVSDTLPPGLKALSITGLAGGSTEENRGPVKCPTNKEVEKGAPLTCTFDGTLPPYDLIEVVISVTVDETASSDEANQATVSGGEAQDASISRPLRIGEQTRFGVEDYELTPEEEGGAPATQAGSHPFQLTTAIALNQVAGAKPAALVKDLNFRWPPGLVGNPTPLARCALGQFLAPAGEADSCPPDTAVGVAVVNINEPLFLHVDTLTVPLFNLEPTTGEPARFGFWVPSAGVPVLIDPAVRAGIGDDYGITVSTTNVSQTAAFLSSEVTVWGVPGDPRHDSARGWGCLAAARGRSIGIPCTPLEAHHPPAFLTLPTSCASPLQTSVEGDSWEQPTERVSSPGDPMPTLDGCNRLSFTPKIQAEPTSDRAAAPSGLDFNLDFTDEGLTSSEGIAQSQLKTTAVTLPQGLTINPSAGVGLGACTPEDYANETLRSAPGAGCPNDSKLGEVTIETPLLATAIDGSIFIAQPYRNPFGSLVAIYIVARNPETGILIKLAGKVTPDPVTGQLVTTFENDPPLPFDHFNFHFREGQRAPLITPPTCGTYDTLAQLAPWSEPTDFLTDTSPFTITKGFDGGACPVGSAPFKPQIVAGSLNNSAGSFSPFYLHLTRSDADQEISSFSTLMPRGFTGILSGIPFCPESDIALARRRSGTEEEAEPSCPVASRLGHSLVGTGVGAVLAYTPGRIYLAGPYNGDPFSLVSVTSAVVGPFDLGTVVVRFGLRIDRHTAQISVDPSPSEPIPTIIDGIVTHVRDIRVYIDRPSFTLNPTSCNPLAISSTLTSNLGQTTIVSSPFQVASCANLKFSPKFTVSTSGRPSKANGASLVTKLVEPPGSMGTQANISKVKVELPKQLPSRLTTLQKACTNAQFEANPASCPSASIIGHAVVHTPLLPVPLEGPAIFVSHGGEAFPSLVVVLRGYGVTVELVGTTFISKAGVTSTTFKTVPDVPFSTFELTLPQGRFSALAANLPAKANGSFCAQKLVMPTEFIAQNGMAIHQQTPITVTGCPKAKTRSQILKAALRACHRKHDKSRRQACERQAHRQYGPVKRKK
jgi:hypothetical protein